MKESQLEELMSSYRDSLGESRTPPPRPSRRMPKLALSGGLVAVLITGTLLWPQDAAAAATERIRKAILNARTMKMTFEQEFKSGFRLGNVTFYKDGKWRVDGRAGTPLEAIWILKDGRMVTSYKRIPHVTDEPIRGDHMQIMPGADMNAIDFAMQQTDMGRIGIERKITIKNEGADTYVMHLERPSDNYVADILVDKKTDLPISAEIAMSFDATGLRYRQTYTFNQPIADSIFEAPAGKPVLRFETEHKRLQGEWAKPLGAIGTTDVRDARITPDGVIWLVVTPAKSKEKAKLLEVNQLLLPSTIETGDGMRYARTQEMVPSSILGKEQTFEIDGKNVYMVAFVPLGKSAQAPRQATVKMEHRSPHLPGFSYRESKITPEAGEVTVTLQQDNGSLPAYFPSLDMDHFGFQVPIMLGTTKAQAFTKDEDWLSAGRAFEETAAAYQGFLPLAADRPLKEAAQCYEKAGMPAEARRVREELKQILDRRARY